MAGLRIVLFNHGQPANVKATPAPMGLHLPQILRRAAGFQQLSLPLSFASGGGIELDEFTQKVSLPRQMPQTGRLFWMLYPCWFGAQRAADLTA